MRFSLPLFSFLLLSWGLLVGCAGEPTEQPLTTAEKGKLDRTLLRIAEGDSAAAANAQIATTDEGRPVYPVFVHVTDTAAFRQSDLPVNSWSGSIATARFTVEQIRQAVRLEAVAGLRLSGRAEPIE